MNFDHLIQYKAFDRIYSTSGSSILDRVPESEIPKLQMRNVCALISLPLFDRLEGMCDLLSMSKRQFIEAAIVEALEKANTIVNRVGLYESLREHMDLVQHRGHEADAATHSEVQEASK